MTSTASAPSVGRALVPRQAERRYAGLVTRAIAFAVDAAVIDGVALLVVAIVALASTVLYIPDNAKNVLLVVGAGAYVIWGAGYFVAFWATSGRTLGNRVMYIRVASPEGGKLGYRRSAQRFVGLVLAVLPLGLGLVPILVSDRRRGLQDRLANSVVVHDPERREPRPGCARTPAGRT
jgi:uncharacterized RDD family membrane protein YckC